MEIDGFKSLQPYEGVIMMDVRTSNLVDRQVLTPEEAKEAVDGAILDSGFSLEELEAQARSHRFATLNAKLCWMTISTLRKGY